MARKIINNKYQGETGLSSRTKINDNFEELYSNIVPEVFDTIEALQAYALTNPTAYAGKQCVVKGNPSSVYIINQNKSITLVATSSNINSLVNIDLSSINSTISSLQNQLAYKADLFNGLLSKKQIPTNILLSDGSITLSTNTLELGVPIEITLDSVIVVGDYSHNLEIDLFIILRILINKELNEYENVEKRIKQFTSNGITTSIQWDVPFEEFKEIEYVSLKGNIYVPLTNDSIITKRYIDVKADLDVNGKVLSSQLPAYVDEVLEYANYAALPSTGVSGKIYVTLDNNKTYRWSGSVYVEISSSLSLGTSENTAYRGDRGNAAYIHSISSHAPINAQKNSDITPEEIAAKLPTNILLNDGTTQMTDSQVQEILSRPFSFIPINSGGDGMSYNSSSISLYSGDFRSIFTNGSFIKLYGGPNEYYVVVRWATYHPEMNMTDITIESEYTPLPHFLYLVKISNIPVAYTPKNPKDIATKEYVDSKSVTYTNSTHVQQALGGISVGETFENVSVVEIFDKLLYPYQSPAFSSFGLSNGRTILECGENWNGVTNASFAFTNVSNVKADSLAIYQDATTLVSAQPITSPIAVTLIQANKSVDGQFITMKVEAKNTNNILFNRSYNVTWYMPYYFGVGNAGLDVTAIQSLSKTVTSEDNITRAYNTNNQVPYLAYPISRDLLTSILDKNGYETLGDFTRTTRTFIINGISVQYYVYEHKYPSTANNLQVTYKY